MIGATEALAWALVGALIGWLRIVVRQRDEAIAARRRALALAEDAQAGQREALRIALGERVVARFYESTR